MVSAFPDVFSAVAAFCVPAALVTVAPGADTALVLRAALVGGGRSAAATAGGVAAGLLVWGGASALGAAALLAAHPGAHLALRLGGAAYLALLGARLLWAAVRPRAGAGPAGGPHGPAAERGGFARGLVTNLLNPKIGIFYLALLPQFAVDGVAPAALGGLLALVHAALALAWLGGLGAAAGCARRALSRPGAARGVEAATGAALVAMGAALAAAAP